jgi:uncharacterized membrane protein
MTPYICGIAVTTLFLVQAIPGVSSASVLHIVFVIASLLMIVVIPGIFVVGLAFPNAIALSPLGYLALSIIASLFVNLTVGYVLSSYRVLDGEWLYLGIGFISAALIPLTWRVRGRDFWVCRLQTEMLKEFTRRRKWPSLAMGLAVMAVFVVALVVSLQSDHRVYPSVYLTNRQGKLSGYPVQLQYGQSQLLILHVDNQGAVSQTYVIREVDNGRTIWLERRVIGDNRVWSRLVRLPGADVGVNRVHVVVREQGRVTANLHVTYRVHA